MSVEILGESYDVNIKQLRLINKNISKLPESIGKLVNLKELHLDKNQLTVIPESIGNLVRLEYLVLDYNRLTSLPESIDKLVNLIYLYLSCNQLENLPKSIGKLINLKLLDLDNNQLKILPTSILNIKKSLRIWVNAYEINNLSTDIEFLIFSYLDKELTNLPTGLKEIWIEREHKNLNHKLPFGCVIKYFE
jgi:Leucine-rich repeat (LRR) protein